MPSTTSTGEAPARPVQAPDPLDTVRRALAETARLQGLDAQDAELIYDAGSWVFRLPGGVVGKVHNRATHYAALAAQVRAATALQAAGIQTAAPIGRIGTAAGHLVTFAEDLGPDEPGEGEYGELLARLHALRPAPELTANPKDKITRTLGRLRGLRPTAISEADRTRLRRLFEAAVDAYHQTAWPEPCLTHGDVTLSNAARTPAGAALLDLETLGPGNLAFDQATPAFARDAFSKDPDQYDAWTAGYGYDIAAQAPGRYELLVPIMGINSCAFYLNLADRSRPDARPQADHRLDTLLSHRPLPWDWTPGAVTRPPTPDRARSANLS
ncbi:hypothetical protein [Kitasatospora phosalacinea]|uniref:Aminoglycoside phosphotransferase n=1 Tax=Kitasatospora phosalacinea TaxID=2065 RepID=A0A9W6PP22_9ACTN|nr:hypothetical protein [Kitasatospora phosalacinea]GLW58551.1 aminoglycoside phosphotransferase [Kitasatospora phosalacinea]